MIKNVMVAILLSISAGASAQDMNVELSPKRNAGIPFSIAITFSDVSSAPQAPDIKIEGLEVNYVGPQSQNKISIVNGRRTQSSNVMHSYEAKGPAGIYSLPALSVSVGGKTLTSKAQDFKISRVRPTTDVTVSLSMPSSVWVGQTAAANLEIKIKRRRDIESLDLTLPMASMTDTFKLDAPAAPSSRRVLTLDAAGLQLHAVPQNGSQWVTFDFPINVTFLKAGKIAVPTATVVSQIQTGSKRDRFGFPVATYVPRMSESAPLEVEVRALPAAGQPNSFSGAIGERYQLEVVADRTVVKVGEAIQLTMSLKGQGVAAVAEPNLAASLPKDAFRVLDVAPGSLTDQDAEYKATVEVLTNKVTEIPAIEFSYFDAKNGAYKTTSSNPIALSVAGAAVVGSGQVVDLTKQARVDKSSQGLSLEGFDLSLSNSSGKSSSSRWYLLLYGVGLVLVLGVVVWSWLSRKRQSNSQHRSALSRIKQEIRECSNLAAGESSGRLVNSLQELAKSSGQKCDPKLISQLESEGYNPRASSEPLKNEILIRVKEEAKRLSTKVAAVAFVLFSMAHMKSAEASPGTDLYQQAMATEDVTSRASKFNDAAHALSKEAESNTTADALTNAGNAWLGAKSPGLAMYYYRRALTIDPTNKKALNNRVWLEKQLPEWAREKRGEVSSVLFWQRYSEAGKGLLAAILFFVASLAIVFWVMKRRGIFLALGMLLYVFCGVIHLSSILSDEEERLAVMVSSSELRQADSIHAPTVWQDPLPAAAVVVVETIRGSFVKVRLGALSGWVNRETVREL